MALSAMRYNNFGGMSLAPNTSNTLISIEGKGILKHVAINSATTDIQLNIKVDGSNFIPFANSNDLIRAYGLADLRVNNYVQGVNRGYWYTLSSLNVVSDSNYTQSLPNGISGMPLIHHDYNSTCKLLLCNINLPFVSNFSVAIKNANSSSNLALNGIGIEYFLEV